MLDLRTKARSRSVLFLALLVGACAIGGGERGDNVSHAESVGCSARVIMQLTVEPSDAVLADLERTHLLELERQGAITNDLRIYVLRTTDSADCDAAIDRLRRDERVRSIDPDSRREIHE